MEDASLKGDTLWIKGIPGLPSPLFCQLNGIIEQEPIIRLMGKICMLLISLRLNQQKQAEASVS